MMTKNTVMVDQWQVTRNDTQASRASRHPSPVTRFAFSMVELLVAMTLLSLIVLALMAVFNSTQRAFRASVTQTDVLEGGRAAMDLISSDLRGMTPSDYSSNYYIGTLSYFSAVNFYATNNSPFYQAYAPMVQSLPGTGSQRSNLLQYFFMLGRQNNRWTGTGYIVDTTSANPLYPLYRFYAETNISVNPVTLYSNFMNTIAYSRWTNMSHVLNGVIHMVVRPYDPNGYLLTNGYSSWQTMRPANTWFSPPVSGEVGCAFYSNSVPASVELQLGVLEDRTLQRAESLGVPGTYPSQYPNGPQWLYLEGQAGHVQLFRQRVTIPNVDLSAYQ